MTYEEEELVVEIDGGREATTLVDKDVSSRGRKESAPPGLDSSMTCIADLASWAYEREGNSWFCRDQGGCRLRTWIPLYRLPVFPCMLR